MSPMSDAPATTGAPAPAAGQSVALASAQRKALRAQAHALEPVVRLGRAGLTDTACGEIERALAHHELIKVKVAAERDQRKRIAAEIPERVPCAVVGAIGQVVILYRPHADPEKRRVRV
jgi:RNA-binding protein